MPGSRSSFREAFAPRRRATGRNSRSGNEEIAKSAQRGGADQVSSGVQRRFARHGWLAAIAVAYLYVFPFFPQIHSANELPRVYLVKF